MAISSRNSERADKIVLAATQLFSRQGYNGTSTREIARLADVSENTLFRHFEHKEDLFWAALRSQTVWLEACKDSLDEVTPLDAPEVVVPKIMGMLTDAVNFRPHLLRLVAVAFLELPWKAEAYGQEQLGPVCATICNYLKASMKSGRVRELDPSMVTTAMMTLVLMHAGLSRMINSEHRACIDNRQATRAYTKFWLDILAPRLAAFARPIATMSGPALV
jgi:AcrR family transcriptional regulator